EASEHLAQLTGLARVQAKFQGPDSPSAKLTHDITVQLKQARCAHPMLPRPLERMEVTARLVDGVVPEATLTAASGPTRLEARIADFRLPDHKPECVC